MFGGVLKLHNFGVNSILPKLLLISQSDWLICRVDLPYSFYIALRLFSNRTQMTSKCEKNEKVTHEAIVECVIALMLRCLQVAGCNACYIGETSRHLLTDGREHRSEQA